MCSSTLSGVCSATRFALRWRVAVIIRRGTVAGCRTSVVTGIVRAVAGVGNTALRRSWRSHRRNGSLRRGGGAVYRYGNAHDDRLRE